MAKNRRIMDILDLLDKYYPDNDKCYLNYSSPYELLIATILSAQCTDFCVNTVTEALFKKYISLESFASAQPEELEGDVKPTGFYRNKAKNIIAAAKILKDKYNGIMPSSAAELTALPGVGRKTANVVRSHIFNIPSVVVDTHVARISGRLSLTSSKDPVKIEFELMEILPKDRWSKYNTQIIAFGREICTARKPKCERCFMRGLCELQTNTTPLRC